MTEFTKKDFEDICKEKFEESKKALRTTMDFDFEGIKGFCDKDSKVCQVFFSVLIGKPFDSANDGHITEVLEKGVSSSDNLAETMNFIYVNFIAPDKQEKKEGEPKVVTEETKSNEATSKEATETKKGGRGKGKANWAEKDVPFSEGSIFCSIFELVKGHTGTKGELLVKVVTLFESLSKNTANASPRLDRAIKLANSRGWSITFDDADVISIARQ